jgi:hypothetical protein
MLSAPKTLIVASVTLLATLGLKGFFERSIYTLMGRAGIHNQMLVSFVYALIVVCLAIIVIISIDSTN